MDMDMGWCLTCAKRTRDQRSPYCSEACRQQDTVPSTPATEPMVITSPLPPKLAQLPPARVSDTPSGISSPTPGQPRQRDRRAFSFPASEEEERPSLPNFNRKTKAVNSTSRTFKGYTSPNMRMSTGGNTPNDSALASDSEDGKSPRRPPLSPLASVSILHPHPPLPMTRVHGPDMHPTSHGTSLSSQLHTARPSLERRGSPVARMASSSSRSREDIISWARGVEDTVRTKGRGRRPEALANLTPPSTEPLDEPQGTTPRSGTALSALNMTLGPVVNALRNVSLGSAPAPETGLQTCATTTVSRIDVTADLAFIEGGTPTLSTISMSEAVDPSNATDMGETIESATDAFSVTSSHYRTSPPAAPRPMTTMHAAEPSRKSALPLRAPSLQQTASAFWSLSSYLRSFAPFTTPFSLVMSQKPGPARTPTAESETATVTPALGLDLGTASVALPAAARSTDEIIDPAAELVRSVPMNIVIAGNKAQAVIEERAREREAIEYLERSCSRERARNAAKTGAPVAETSDNERGRGRRRARREDSSRERDDVDTPSSESGNEEQRGRRRARGGESRDRSWSAARGRTSRTRGTAVRA